MTSTSRKLALGGAIAVSVTAYMAYLGASTSWRYYLTVDECIAQAATLVGKRIRVSGRVASGSLHIEANRKGADFLLEGAEGRLPVRCRGVVPDNLADNVDVVVEGRLQAPRLFQADKVLTRCASKYQSEHQPAGTPASADVAARPRAQTGR